MSSKTIWHELAAWKGDQRITLLEAIDQTGSITQAARILHISYRHAWDLLHGLGNLAEEPLLATQSGGSRGGGSVLTSYALGLINTYRTLEAEHTARLALAESRWHMLSWQTSARNHFLGRISALEPIGLETLITLAINTGLSMSALVTQTSVSRMHLVLGRETHLMFKASALEIHVTEPEHPENWLGTSLPVHLLQIQQQDNQSELTLYHASGIHIYALCAAQDPNPNLSANLEEGQSLWVSCPARSIVLAVHQEN